MLCCCLLFFLFLFCGKNLFLIFFSSFLSLRVCKVWQLPFLRRILFIVYSHSSADTVSLRFRGRPSSSQVHCPIYIQPLFLEDPSLYRHTHSAKRLEAGNGRAERRSLLRRRRSRSHHPSLFVSREREREQQHTLLGGHRFLVK